jgi:uncharacterized repeat protein (TIGR01451 family)
VHHLRGKDPSAWRRNLPLAGRVTCAGVRPGVDFTVYGRGGLLEFDLAAAPGADLAALELRARGAEALSVGEGGDLTLRAGETRLVLRKPVAYQPSGDARAAVDARFVLRGGERIGFATGPHDPALPLVIDPVLELSSYAGGNRVDTARAVAAGADGTVVVAGRAESNDFPTTPGSFQPDYAGANNDFDRGDVFVMKLAPGGESVLWATYLGGDDTDHGEDVAIGADGDVFVVGTTDSKDFPTRAPIQPERSKDTVDAFAARLTSAGDDLVYSTYLGGKEVDQANGVAVDESGNATLVGFTFSKDFPVSPGVFQPARSGDEDAFVTRLGPNGSLLWSTYLGGEDLTAATAVTLAADGGAVVAGVTSSNQFPTSTTAFQPKYGTEGDGFVSKLDADGAELVWSTFLSGKDGNPFAFDRANDVALDADENVYVAGDTLSRDFPVSAGAFDVQCGKNGTCTQTDGFVVKLSPDACALLYGTYLGEEDADAARALAVDARGHAHVTGFTRDNQFPVTPDAFQSERKDAADAFLSEFDAGGSALVYSTFFGSGDDDAGNGVALDGASFRRNVVGSSAGNNLPIVGDAFQPDFEGDTDGFVAVFAGLPEDEAALFARLAATPNPSVVGDEVAFELDVRNAGSAAAAGVEAEVTLPAGLGFGTATPSQGSCSFAAPILSCALGAIAAGGSASVSFDGTPSAPGVLLTTARASADDAASVAAAACVEADVHDLALLSLKVPKSLKVPAGGSATGSISVEIQNDSTHDETVVDLAMLSELVTVTALPTGAACPAGVVALDPKSGSKLPLVIEPGKKLKVSFTVTVSCAETDYTVSAEVDHTALDGLPDSNPANDVLGGALIDAEPR